MSDQAASAAVGTSRWWSEGGGLAGAAAALIARAIVAVTSTRVQLVNPGLLSPPTGSTIPREPGGGQRPGAGTTAIVAMIRGTSRYRVGFRAIDSMASISSVTTIVPSSAAMDAPAKPLMTMPVMMGPSMRKPPTPMTLDTDSNWP